MKKKFNLTNPKLAPARQVDAIKGEINKYIARERRKTPAAGADFWDFDCKFGKESSDALTIHVSEIGKSIDQFVLNNEEMFYIEILAKPGHRINKKKS
jgi:hypothetical protein